MADMIATGVVRYPIGGKEIGQVMTDALASAKFNVERATRDLEKLQLI